MSERDHLLRTLAAVPPHTRVLEVECGDAGGLISLLQLGFSVTGTARDEATLGGVRQQLRVEGLSAPLVTADAGHLPFEDDAFDWVVAWGTLDGYSDAERLALLAEWRRVLVPGGWVYVAVAPATGADTLAALGTRAAFEVAEAPRVDPAAAVTRGIFRRVEADTIS